MLTRRGFSSCALCAAGGFVATGFVATGVAQAPTGASGESPSGVRREILKRTDGPIDGYEIIIASADIAASYHVPRHIHPGVESAYIIAGGGVLSLDGDGDREVKAGDVVQVPAWRPHRLQNGDKPTRIIATYVIQKGQPITIPA